MKCWTFSQTQTVHTLCLFYLRTVKVDCRVILRTLINGRELTIESIYEQLTSVVATFPYIVSKLFYARKDSKIQARYRS